MDQLRQSRAHAEYSGDTMAGEVDDADDLMEHMEIDSTDYQQPKAFIPNRDVVTKLLQGQGKFIDYRSCFNSVKHAKNFCHKQFKGTQLQEVYHLQEHHCSTAICGGRGKNAYVLIHKADPRLYMAQSQMHAQQGLEQVIQGKGSTGDTKAEQLSIGDNKTRQLAPTKKTPLQHKMPSPTRSTCPYWTLIQPQKQRMPQWLIWERYLRPQSMARTRWPCS